MDVKELERMIRQHEAGIDMAVSAAFPALMRKVYVWMTLALVLSGVTAYGVATSPNLLALIANNSFVMWGLLLGELGLVLAINAGINKMSLTMATLLFALFSILNGATLSFIFLAYAMTTIAKVFFITAGTFAATAIYGYTTKRDLTKLGGLLTMGLIGLIIASLVNVFLVKSTGFDLIVSYIGVLIFVGLTAWDSQRIKVMMAQAEDLSERSQKLAVLGAMSLYLDFINLFLYLLRIFGNRE
ncbi:Bax inhibitor-1/YccA family protein [Prevotella sp. S7 MS 2]|uniref:Bax inhibitor-1/YccA family protein n=1 Tax=Prevotella sp. S7 MS 2 TaxID=1287488 RepID=UPI0005145423|nr:Bax inhibitor-1/YccA family protein [Prevotella sp. S7 MS 2]KGI60987.1 membrane protein [Prevotella sp. S7 MS 2]